MRILVPSIFAATLLIAAAAAAEPADAVATIAAGIGLEPAAELTADPGPDDYAAYALAHNDDLAAAAAAWEAARARDGVAGALPDPRFTWSEAIEPVETRVGPQQRILALVQPVPWFGTLGLRRAVETERAGAERAHAEAVALRVIRETKAAYHELVYLDRAVATTAAHLELVTRWEAVARARYEAGRGRYADAIKAQVELGVLEDRLAEFRARRRPLGARLNAAVGQPVAAEVSIRPVEPVRMEADLADLQARLLADNPELDAAGREAEGRRLATDLAGKRRYPDFSLGVTWVQVGDARMDGVPGSGKDALFAVVGLSLPLWQGSYGSAEREAGGRLRAAEHRRSDLARALTARLEQAVFDHRDAGRRLGLYRDTLLPKARQSLEAARAGYEAGELSYLDLVDAERVLIEFELAASRAAADVMISRADIDQLIGRVTNPGED